MRTETTTHEVINEAGEIEYVTVTDIYADDGCLLRKKQSGVRISGHITLSDTDNADDWTEDAVLQWQDGLQVRARSIVIYEGTPYKCLQSHTTQSDWLPSVTPTLWRVCVTEDWTEWVQPTGVNDAYMTGERVTFEGVRYISSVDYNVWSPAAYPEGWEIYEEN